MIVLKILMSTEHTGITAMNLYYNYATLHCRPLFINLYDVSIEDYIYNEKIKRIIKYYFYLKR